MMKMHDVMVGHKSNHRSSEEWHVEFLDFSASECVWCINIKPLWWYLELIKRTYKIFLLCAFVELLNSMGTNIAYYHHIPLRPGHIYDFGQEVIPELGKGNHERTEIMFWGSFVGMVFAALSPLVLDLPCTHIANLLWREFAAILLVTILRIPTYLATVLPSTNYHCHPGAIEYDPPITWWDIITRMDSSTGCGDMIFSGHITFATLVCCAFVDYLPELGVSSFGRHIWTVLCTLIVVGQATIIIAARKHYTVDLVTGIYVSVLVYYFVATYFPNQDPLPHPARGNVVVKNLRGVKIVH